MNPHKIETEGLPSASEFDANFRCLGKRALEARLPEREEDAVLRRGSKIHRALEKSDLSTLAKSDEVTASRCMYAEAELVHDYNFEGSSVLWEYRIWDTDEFKPLWSVKIDAAHFHPTEPRALTGDYKTGYSVTVPIEVNWQVKAEAVAIALDHDLEQVVSALIHPHHPDSLYEVTVFDRTALGANLLAIRGYVAQIQMPDQPRTPNPISCQYCQAKRICPEYQAQEKALLEAAALEVKEQGWTALIDMTPAARGQRYKAMKMAKANLEEMMLRYALFAEKDPEAIKGWQLTKSWSRKILDEGEALRLVSANFGHNAASAAIRFSLPALEEYLGRSMSAKDAKERVQAVLHSLIKFEKKQSYLKERTT